MRSRPYDHDKRNMLPRDPILHLTGRALHVLQNESPEEMVAAASMLFALVTQRVQLDAQEEHHKALKMLRDQRAHDKENKLLQSLRDFAGLRIKGQEVTIS